MEKKKSRRRRRNKVEEMRSIRRTGRRSSIGSY